eukprot:7885487-Pyramimonas_sp.AAC.1
MAQSATVPGGTLWRTRAACCLIGLLKKSTGPPPPETFELPATPPLPEALSAPKNDPGAPLRVRVANRWFPRREKRATKSSNTAQRHSKTTGDGLKPFEDGLETARETASGAPRKCAKFFAIRAFRDFPDSRQPKKSPSQPGIGKHRGTPRPHNRGFQKGRRKSLKELNSAPEGSQTAHQALQKSARRPRKPPKAYPEIAGRPQNAITRP